MHKLSTCISDDNFLIVKEDSGECIIGTTQGVCIARAMKRKPLDQRWSYEQLMAIKGTFGRPYKLNGSDKRFVSLTGADGAEDDRREKAKIGDWQCDRVIRYECLTPSSVISIIPWEEGCWAMP